MKCRHSYNINKLNGKKFITNKKKKKNRVQNDELVSNDFIWKNKYFMSSSHIYFGGLSIGIWNVWKSTFLIEISSHWE